MMALFGSVWAKLIAVGAIALALGGMLWRALAGAKKAGVDQEHGRQADAWNQTQTNVDRAVSGVGSLGDDAVRDELRASLNPAAPGASPPLQPRPSPGSTDRR